MSSHDAALVTVMQDILARSPGMTVLMGSPALAAQLELPPSGLLVVERQLSARTLRRYRDRIRPLWADPEHLPIREQSLGALVAVRAVVRSPHPEALVEKWSLLLSPGGRMLVLEPEVEGTILGGLRRLVAHGTTHRPPEAITGLLLNAGLSAIGQRWPGGSSGLVVTHGTRCHF